MAINFPDSPTVNQTYAVGDRTWKWTGATWDALGQPAVPTTNAIINGAFDIWQRGTSFTDGFTADRWRINANGSGVTKAITQQTFTPGTAPVAGYEGQYYLRWNQSVAGTGATLAFLQTPIEDVRTFAGQTVTVSFWAKSDAARNITTGFWRNYGSGGSGVDYGISENTYAITTSWARYSFTTSLSSLTGKTIGAGSYLLMYFSLPINTAHTFDIWGVQLEAGSVATPFKRNAPSIGLEETNAYRYTQTKSSTAGSRVVAYGSAYSATKAYILIPHSPNLRTGATSVDFDTVYLSDGVTDFGNASAVAIVFSSATQTLLDITVAGGMTQYRPIFLQTRNGSSVLRLNNEL